MTDTKQATSITIPSGFVMNAAGHLVPENQVREHDKLRDGVARDLGNAAERISALLAEFKKQALADIADLIAVSSERYGVKLGGQKGNVSITTYDGQYKIERTFADRIVFTEEILAARELINNCISDWSEGANNHLRVLVDRAFRANKQGQLMVKDVLSLLRIEINDPVWKTAMQALKDSIQVNGTAVYIRVYKRHGNTDQYLPINLTLAGV
ncbi:DUF3164 family protein [Pseudomonas sp. zfem002]|uniref:DUF3164 family protein n=1 Tax=Pseudomonas sp. zfem002 TaxID=3078197 RepID=UPI002928E010|nr:DUF3164 family protein [Pseudomonas sp. zfem002]MDU9392115.1 DUF3164 family protein [Pseudomonas sp. zfem002]